MIALLDIVGLVGITIIVTKSALFCRVRRLVSFLSCPQCFGWHMGFWATVLSYAPFGGYAAEPWPVVGSRFWHAVLIGGVVSLASTLADCVIDALDEVVLKLQGKPGNVVSP